MKDENKLTSSGSYKGISLIISVLVLSLSISYIAFAWNEPTAVPPGDNVSPPLNISATDQSKEGGLILNTSGASANGLVVQNGNVGIGALNPEFKLSIDNDGGIIAKGTYGSGNVLSTSGAGTRLIWYPKKAAFRAGIVYGTEWDDVNVGNYSFAVGEEVIASGEDSIAMGYDAIANSNAAVAIGYSVVASNWGALAMGNRTIASGNTSTALGSWTTASGDVSVAMGQNSVASGWNSTAIGWCAEASGPASTALGGCTLATADSAIAMGAYTEANGIASTSTGHQTVANGIASIAMGDHTTANIDYSTSAGRYVTANATNAIILGQGLTNTNRLTNNTASSLMVGFNSDTPTFFVGPSAGMGTIGNVGIGTTTPGAKLEIAGDVKIVDGAQGAGKILTSDADGLASWQVAVTGLPTGTSGQTIRYDGANWVANDLLYNNGIDIGIGTTTPGAKLEVAGVVVATTFLYSSDERLKENIIKIDNPLEKISKLDGVSFTWKENGEKSIGLIAQNLEEVFPELVKTNEESGMKSVEYGNLVAPLIEAIKEQQKMIEEQQEQINILKIKLENIIQ